MTIHPPDAPRNSSVAARRRAASGAAHHTVQFYEDDDFLADAVGAVLAEGLAAGGPAIIIATGEHGASILLRLEARGIDVAHARATGRLMLLDAGETLAAIMRGPLPDRERFVATLGGAIERSRPNGTGGACPQLYGEMVDVLWAEENPKGAIRLEELWNELAETHAFSLLCGYSMEKFDREAHASDFDTICGLHAHVIPTERYMLAGDEARLAEVSVLQQRTHALEREIEERKALELRLRDELVARRRAEEAAHVASRAKSEFLATMSHELRTPLNAIAGHVQLIELGVHGPVTDAQRAALARVQRNQRHLLALINDMLNLTRSGPGRVEYVLEAIPLVPLLTDVVAMVEPLLLAHELAAESPAPERGDAAIRVRADRERVQQILLNLLTNAIKFTPTGGWIAVEVTASADVPAMACVRVRDSGIGISPANVERIFEPFVRLATRMAGEQDGVGLGLAISRDLARGMGGDLTAASAPGEGATFTLTLPRA